MATIRGILKCIGVNTKQPEISVLFHLFGFWRERVPTDPDSSVIAQVSLLSQVKGLKGPHIHLNVIEVGFDSLPSSDMDPADEAVDYAIYKTRNIYRTVGLGVGRVSYYLITTAEADGMDDLSSEDEAEELRDAYGVNNNGIDAFVVRNISSADFSGVSPEDGSCDNGSKDDGLIAGEITRRGDGFARTFAHEIGHFLGLSHNHDDDSCPDTPAGQLNLMAQTICASSVRDSVVLTSFQGNMMKDHCAVRDGC